jgi:hypothetical protein
MPSLPKYGLTLCAAAVLLGAAVFAPQATAKKKSVATSSETAPLASSQTQTASAKCPGGMNLTGGGFSVAPPYDPAGSVGTKTMAQVSRPEGKKTWVGSAGALQVPISAGTFTTYARCQKKSLGKTQASDVGTAIVPPKGGQTMTFNCRGNAHVLYGGFGTDRPFSVPDLGSSQLVPVQSQRVTSTTWMVTAYNASATAPATMFGYAGCEANKKASKVSIRSATVPLNSDARTSAQLSCRKKQHVVGGGFSITPLPVAGGTVPSAGVDENMPLGKKTWKIGAFENPGFTLPAGSALTAQTLCKKD